MSAAVLVAIGLGAGVFAGLFGIGGGVVIVPALVLLAKFPLVTATGTSLAAILLPVGILGAIAYYRAGILDVRAALWLDLGILSSVVAGAWLANALPAADLRRVYALFLLYVSWNFIQPLRRVRRMLGKRVEEPPERNGAPRAKWWVLVLFGVGAGVGAGMFGIGGGNIIVPMLTLFLGFTAKRAIATSLGALLLPMGLPGVLVYHHAGTLDIRAALWIAAGLFVGTLVGAKITIRLPSATVKLVYGIFLVFMAARFLVGK